MRPAIWNIVTRKTLVCRRKDSTRRARSEDEERSIGNHVRLLKAAGSNWTLVGYLLQDSTMPVAYEALMMNHKTRLQREVDLIEHTVSPYSGRATLRLTDCRYSQWTAINVDLI